MQSLLGIFLNPITFYPYDIQAFSLLTITYDLDFVAQNLLLKFLFLASDIHSRAAFFSKVFSI